MRNLLHKAYSRIPLKRQAYSLIKKFVSPRKQVYQHLHFKGPFEIQVDRDHSFKMLHHGFELENELFWNGLDNGWERTSLSLWVKLVSRAGVIVDVGANTGIYSLVAKCLNPQADVYAFEPIARVFEKLDANRSLNEFDFECVMKALSDTDGTAEMFDLPAEHVYSVTVNKNLHAPDVKVVRTEIEVLRLDTFIEAHDIKKIDLLKIDVETHEPEVLLGLGAYLHEFRPTLLIEILSDEIGRKIEEIIDGLNYRYFNIHEELGSVREVTTITCSDYYNYLLCDDIVARELGLGTPIVD